MTNDDTISAEEAAQIIGISVQAVRAALRAGKIAGKQLGQRTWAVSRQSALAYKQERERRQSREGETNAGENQEN
jgi:hypothetical protein